MRRLFPFTWSHYSPAELPIHLGNLAFSPLIPGATREASLPVYAVLWRAENPTDESLDVALMLTWACGWPDLVPGVVFDLQHDNLCITGSLGQADSPNRMGIAVPDLHSEEIYLQGLEPWDAAGDGAELWEDFADDGELDPAIARGESLGAAAWVKFSLDPGEAKEIPFVIVWHFPVYESGPVAGQARYYTKFLEKHRPDNAVVWLAEEVVENYGTEAANYRSWIHQIQDWQQTELDNPHLSQEKNRRRINGLSGLLEVDTIWTDDNRFGPVPRAGYSLTQLRESMHDAIPVKELWPDVPAQMTTDLV